MKRFNPVLTYSGTPPLVTFQSTDGTPIVIDTTTSKAYYNNAGTVTQIAGSGGGGVTTVTGTSPVVSSGGTTPAISLLGLSGLGSALQVVRTNAAATALEYATLSGGGTVTSVGVGSTGSTLTVTGSPVTGSGTINAELNLAHENAWTATQYVTETVLTDAATINLNVTTQTTNCFLLTTAAVGSSRTMALPTGVQPKMVVNYEVKQPSSGGPCAIVWASGFLWGQGGSAPAPIASQVAGASEFYSFIVQHDGNLHGVMIGQSGPAGAGYKATSSTSSTIGTGSKTFTVQAGLAYLPGDRVRFTETGLTAFEEGLVTAYSLASMTVLVDLVSGSGTFSSWNVGLAGQAGSQGIQGIQGVAGTGNGVNLQTGTSYTIVSGDLGKLLSFTNASAVAVALPQATGSFASPAQFDLENRGPGTVTITPTTSTIDGAATLALTTNQGCRFFSDGTNWYTQRGVGGTSSGSSTISWSTTDKAAVIQLSSRFVATNYTGGASYNLVRATLGVNIATSTLYFEVSVAASNVTPWQLIIGIAQATTPTNTFVGSDTVSWGYQGSNGATVTNSAIVSTYTVYHYGASIGVLIKNGALYFRLNGVWQGGSNPATNTSPAFTGLTGTVYPAVSLNGATDAVTGCFRAASQVYNDWPAWDPS